MKQLLSKLGILVLSILLSGVLSGAAPMPAPNVTFTLVSGLPATMNVGDTATVVVEVTSDQEYIFAQMLPTTFYPGRGVVAQEPGGDRSHAGSSTTLQVTFVAKGSTADFANGQAPVSVVVGLHYQGGATVSQRYDFLVEVP